METKMKTFQSEGFPQKKTIRSGGFSQKKKTDQNVMTAMTMFRSQSSKKVEYR